MRKSYLHKLDPSLEAFDVEDVIETASKKDKRMIKTLSDNFWTKDDDAEIGHDKFIF